MIRSMIRSIKNIADAFMGMFSKQEASASRTACAGVGPHKTTPPDCPQRPHYQQIADAEFYDALELKRDAELRRRVQFDLET